MADIYHNIIHSLKNHNKLLAVLIDPDKVQVKALKSFIQKVNQSIADYIFVGGSTVYEDDCDKVVEEIKRHSKLPIVLFPGDVTQITNKADAMLFLSLISGRNPEYLIGKHVESISKLRESELELIPTGYILIENGRETSVQSVTQTKPLLKSNIQLIVDTALAGQLLGMKLIYLEAGSGAIEPVHSEIINQVKKNLNIPVVVGGGIKTIMQIESAYESGADMVVIGTAFEQDETFLEHLYK